MLVEQAVAPVVAAGGEGAMAGRFTPGAGRVHFRLVPEQRSARVAYVGLKLGI